MLSSIYKEKKDGFTLLELVFVIVILGVVSSITSSVIAKVYESYITQRAMHNASLKSDLAINQLANRLLYRVDNSVLARVPGNTGMGAGNALALRNISSTTPNKNNYTALEWIAYDNDGFTAQNQPSWSGFCDLNASTYTNVVTTGSNLDFEQTVLTNILGTSLSTTDRPALLFMGNTYKKSSIVSSDPTPYEASCMYNANGCIFPITVPLSGTNITLSDDGNRTAGEMIYSEFYHLVASAYAVVPENNANGTFDLKLYSSYQPWLGENYTQGKSSLLAKNVSVFRFSQETNSIRIKLCTIERIGENNDSTISICKEKAVIR